ncbi:manganese-repressed peroxidase [Lentinus tigrinus ALCF2SS1-7]|uniref:Peroxidase n=1 Tax=Lentinus tigrinus ALCF2SS1-6 TaxID=1328759 RepID=A0A5C2RQX4_9APHY|nr:manganese-repressed peroxidase [Lentinus tigrinus ALCF2SS1-6]RPD78547.1 manganese-repressed peroxidase [Lentinus tigrinus ALCF2SS1-7]
MFSKTLLSLVVLAASVAAAVPSVSKRATCSNGKTTANDACCVWFDVLDDIQANLFHGGECGEDAHESLRLTFHDAIAFSPSLTASGQFGGGGADGSIMAHTADEIGDPANLGLDDIIEAQRPFAIKHNVSFGDFIQFAGAVGVSNCNGAPQIAFLAGRSNDSQPAPHGLIPLPTDSSSAILARVKDAGFSAVELVWLLISHTVGAQDKVDDSIPGAPFDSTPSDFDAQFFVETMINGTLVPGNGLHDGEVLSPYPGEFRLQSDFAIARDPNTSCEWQKMISNRANMLARFQQVMKKLSTLGFDQSTLTDCSDVIPVPTGTVRDPFLPAGKSMSDIEAACSSTPFPTLSADSGPVTTIPAVNLDS